MINVSRKPKYQCISCFDQTNNGHDIRIGSEDNNKTVISLCPECLLDLYNEIAETLDEYEE
jgi:hypothetical protein